MIGQPIAGIEAGFLKAQKPMAQIYVSYSKSDHQAATAIIAAIRQAGLDPFDDSHLQPGGSFNDIIVEAVDNAQCVVVLWSRAAANSEWVQLENTAGLKSVGIRSPGARDTGRNSLAGWVEGPITHSH
jgi:hypothetical protein